MQVFSPDTVITKGLLLMKSNYLSQLAAKVANSSLKYTDEITEYYEDQTSDESFISSLAIIHDLNKKTADYLSSLGTTIDRVRKFNSLRNKTAESVERLYHIVKNQITDVENLVSRGSEYDDHIYENYPCSQIYNHRHKSNFSKALSVITDDIKSFKESLDYIASEEFDLIYSKFLKRGRQSYGKKRDKKEGFYEYKID